VYKVTADIKVFKSSPATIKHFIVDAGHEEAAKLLVLARWPRAEIREAVDVGVLVEVER
jgi:hypothetical protein